MKTGIALGVVAAVLAGCGEDNQGPGVPDAPASVTATITGTGAIEITWTPVDGATKYNVYMAAVAGVKRISYTTLPGNMFHPDLASKFDHPPGLDLGTQYYFVVTAENDNGESVESCEVVARMSPATANSC